MRNYTLLKGFSLIELMIVIAIIGILAAIAVPSYNNYVKKAKIGNILSYMQALEVQVAESYSTSGSPPSSLVIGSTTIGINTLTPISGGPEGLTRIYFSPCNQGEGGNNCKVLIGGEVDPNIINGAQWLTIAGVPGSDGSVSFYCGYWQGNGASQAQLDVLPSTCKTDSLSFY